MLLSFLAAKPRPRRHVTGCFVLSLALAGAACSASDGQEVTSETSGQAAAGVGRDVEANIPTSTVAPATTAASGAASADAVAPETSNASSSEAPAAAAPSDEAVGAVLPTLGAWTPVAAVTAPSTALCPGTDRPSVSVEPSSIEHVRWASSAGAVADLRTLRFADATASFSFFLHVQRGADSCEASTLAEGDESFEVERESSSIDSITGAVNGHQINATIFAGTREVAESVTVLALADNTIIELRVMNDSLSVDDVEAAREAVAVRVAALQAGGAS